MPVPIAFCITELDPGGAERALAALVRGLDRSAWEPHVFCLGPETPLAESIRRDGIPVTCLGARSWRDLGVVVRLTRELRRLKPRLLQTFLFHGNLLGRIAAKRAGVPIVVSGIRVAEREQRWHVSLECWTRGFVTHHVCVSEGVAAFVREAMSIPRDRITVIPNGVDGKRFDSKERADWAAFGIPEGADVLLTIGRLTPQKDHATLLLAFSQVASRREPPHLVIVGEGPLRGDLEQHARSLKLTGRVHFAGSRTDVPALLRAARGFVLSSRWEGMPNVLLEALAAGCPVVSTDVEGVRELIGNDERGLVVPPGNPAELSRAIDTLLTDSDSARSRAERGREWVLKERTTERTVELYDTLYRHLLGQRR